MNHQVKALQRQRIQFLFPIMVSVRVSINFILSDGVSDGVYYESIY